MMIHSFLEDSRCRYPDKTAVICNDQRISYDQLDGYADCIAAHLQSNGIGKGDRIALMLENSIEYVTAYYATLKTGAVAAPLNPGLKPESLRSLLNDLKPAGIITTFKSERLLKAAAWNDSTLKLLVIKSPKQKWYGAANKVSTYEEAVSVSSAYFIRKTICENDLASIIYTSGSTGRPKGVMLTHKNIVSNTKSVCQYLDLTHIDIQMVVLPFFYVMGKSLLNTHIAAGGTIVINNRFMYPADVVQQMIAENVTGFSGVPSTYAYLLNRSPLANRRKDLSSLRYCSQAGGHMAKSLKLELRKVLPRHTQIVIMYGATEASARLAYLDPSQFENKIESIGKPIPGVTIRLMDEHGKDVATGREGELVASGPNIMRGYWNDQGANTGVLDENGYHTGDIGILDKDGFIYIMRRKDDQIKTGGHRVTSTEIEEFLMATDQLIETAVIGVPDPLLGTKLCALVVPKKENFQTSPLKKICARGLPKHKCPTDIIATRVLPKSSSGKVNRHQCAAVALAAIQQSESESSRPVIAPGD